MNGQKYRRVEGECNGGAGSWNFQTLRGKLAASQIKDDKKISLSTLSADGKVLQQKDRERMREREGEKGNCKLKMKNVVAKTIATTCSNTQRPTAAAAVRVGIAVEVGVGLRS